MQMLVVLGSPRRSGNSETLARVVAETFGESGGKTEFVRLNDLSLRPCQGCGGCDKTGRCVLKDDMGEIYEKVDAADRVLLVSPVYFYGLSAQAKIFVDRMQARWSRKYNLKETFRAAEGRRGYLLATAATTGPKIFDCCELVTRYSFDALELEYGEPLLVKGVDHRGEAAKDDEVMESAREYGRSIGRGEI